MSGFARPELAFLAAEFRRHLTCPGDRTRTVPLTNFACGASATIIAAAATDLGPPPSGVHTSSANGPRTRDRPYNTTRSIHPTNSATGRTKLQSYKRKTRPVFTIQTRFGIHKSPYKSYARRDLFLTLKHLSSLYLMPPHDSTTLHRGRS